VDGTPALAVDGAPSDCVALAVLGLIVEPIHLVVSGINPNANLGHDVTYSGTVTAALEAAIWGLPGVAVSIDAPEGFTGALDFSAAAQVAQTVVRNVQEHGMPAACDFECECTLNLPLDEIKGYHHYPPGFAYLQGRADQARGSTRQTLLLDWRGRAHRCPRR